ncbi:hypothetical protein I3760_08G050900 [Carya illinoinensis]|nr:hypothetical protein I3760_08G050900 [Carya illinoinensis]
MQARPYVLLPSSSSHSQFFVLSQSLYYCYCVCAVCCRYEPKPTVAYFPSSELSLLDVLRGTEIPWLCTKKLIP